MRERPHARGQLWRKETGRRGVGRPLGFGPIKTAPQRGEGSAGPGQGARDRRLWTQGICSLKSRDILQRDLSSRCQVALVWCRVCNADVILVFSLRLLHEFQDDRDHSFIHSFNKSVLALLCARTVVGAGFIPCVTQTGPARKLLTAEWFCEVFVPLGVGQRMCQGHSGLCQLVCSFFNLSSERFLMTKWK